MEIKVPPMGESISLATVSAIIKPSGSTVKEGEEILELETDKVNQVLYAQGSGVISWKVKVGDEVAIGSILGSIEEEAASEQKIPQHLSQETIKPQPSPEKRSPPPIGKTKETRKRMSGLRRTIAERLVEVKNQTAMLTTFNEVDMSKIIAIRAEEKEIFEKRHGVRLGFMPFFVKASTLALKAFPLVGSFIEGDEIVTPIDLDIGVAVSTDKGLFVPVLRKCDTLSFAEIEKTLSDLAKKSREGTITVDDLKGGVFTITNGGTFGSMLSTPILNPPQSAILGMHNIVKRAVVVDDQIVVRPIMYLALSYDHRIIDGKEAVQFLVRIKEILENPLDLTFD